MSTITCHHPTFNCFPEIGIDASQPIIEYLLWLKSQIDWKLCNLHRRQLPHHACFFTLSSSRNNHDGFVRPHRWLPPSSSSSSSHHLIDTSTDRPNARTCCWHFWATDVLSIYTIGVVWLIGIRLVHLLRAIFEIWFCAQWAWNGLFSLRRQWNILLRGLKKYWHFGQFG